ncbi:hypothetical protein [Fibrivirga algicola]|uniref:Uncharacterized protein n=1 Tax=Fibrivirga algicola TaxID=2950420 RepID=A0ABX0QJG9_9BACT|nr:hypothetical protein [Fibrivirga algicola]NID12222.1 hypothetical protein [Fibrivirga algicola]
MTVFVVVVIRRIILTFFRLTGCFGFGFITLELAAGFALLAGLGALPAIELIAVLMSNRPQKMR